MAIPDPRRLIGVISPLIVWAVWFVVVYALTGIGCRAGWNATALPVGNVLSLVMLVSALVAIGLIGWCARLGYIAWRGNRASRTQGDDERAQRGRFMGMILLLASVLAAIGTLLTAVPILMLDPCAA